MSTSFVHRAGRGFWCPDGLLEAFAHELGGALTGTPTLHSYGAELQAMALVGLPGCFDLGFDELSEAQVHEVLSAIDRIQCTLTSRRVSQAGATSPLWDGMLPEHQDRICEAAAAVLIGSCTTTAADHHADHRRWLTGSADARADDGPQE